jgi:Helix-turn-helix domain
MADGRQVAEYGAPGDGTARFLGELRQLRDGAGLGLAELAARAHFPYDIIRAAEAGPGLPDLPVLSAYVRGCGGAPEEWEERWRSLTRSPSLPLEGARSAGNSAASEAGARISSVAYDADTPDPAVIMAALNRVAEGMAEPGAEEAPQPAAASAWPDYPPEAPAPSAPPLPTRPSGPPTDGRPAGWDPIRVSSAWPALPATPLRPAPPSPPPTSGRPGAGAPWDSAPWADAPAGNAAGAGTAGQAWPAASSTAGATEGWAATPNHPGGRARHAPRPEPGQAGGSRTTIIVAVAAVLVVLVVLLAIFV